MPLKFLLKNLVTYLVSKHEFQPLCGNLTEGQKVINTFPFPNDQKNSEANYHLLISSKKPKIFA